MRKVVKYSLINFYLSSKPKLIRIFLLDDNTVTTIIYKYLLWKDIAICYFYQHIKKLYNLARIIGNISQNSFWS